MSDPNPWPSKFQRQLDLANKQISIVSWGIDFRYRVGSGYKLGRECVPYKLIQEFGDAAIIQSDVRSTWKSDPNGKYTLEEMCQSDECKELLGQWLSTIAGCVQSSTNKFLVLSITCSFQCTSSLSKSMVNISIYLKNNLAKSLPQCLRLQRQASLYDSCLLPCVDVGLRFVFA